MSRWFLNAFSVESEYEIESDWMSEMGEKVDRITINCK